MLEAKIIEVAAERRASRAASTGRRSAARTGASRPADRARHGASADRPDRHRRDRLRPGDGRAHEPAAARHRGRQPDQRRSQRSAACSASRSRRSNFAALLQFLETQGNVQVLSSPRIATINNQKAVLKVGTDEFFVTNVTTTTTTRHRHTPPSPTITCSRSSPASRSTSRRRSTTTTQIILHVHPSVSVVHGEAPRTSTSARSATFTLPLASSTVNETDSVVRVQDGNIVAIGGLMKQERVSDQLGPARCDRIGGARQPVRTAATAQLSTKSELVILIKPTVIRSERDWERDSRRRRQRAHAEPATPVGSGHAALARCSANSGDACTSPTSACASCRSASRPTPRSRSRREPTRRR